MKSAIECATGKDFITDEKLSPKERAKCALGAVAGIGDFVPWWCGWFNGCRITMLRIY